MSILIVEDNPVSVKVLDLNLRKHGYKTIMAKSGQEGLDVLENNPEIRLIISDIMMPGMNGLQLLEKIKSNPMLKEISVIMCTAMADMEIVKQAVALGCKYYVVKPLNIGQVIAKVREALREVRPVLISKNKVMSQYNLDSAAYTEVATTFLALVTEKINLLKENQGKDITLDVFTSLFELYESATLIGAERVAENLEKIQEATKNSDKELVKSESMHLMHELQLLKTELTNPLKH